MLKSDEPLPQTLESSMEKSDMADFLLRKVAAAVTKAAGGWASANGAKGGGCFELWLL